MNSHDITMSGMGRKLALALSALVPILGEDTITKAFKMGLKRGGKVKAKRAKKAKAKKTK